MNFLPKKRNSDTLLENYEYYKDILYIVSIKSNRVRVLLYKGIS